MEQEKKKSKLKIIIPIAIVIIAIVGIVVFTSNKGSISNEGVLQQKDNSKEKMIQQAEILNWTYVHNTIKDNPAKSEDYEGKLYFYYGKICDISLDNVAILNSKDVNSLNTSLVSSDRYIYVYLDKAEIKKLNKGDTIYAIGKLEKENGTWTVPCNLKKAILLDFETAKNNNLINE